MCGLLCAWGSDQAEWAQFGMAQLAHRGPDASALRRLDDLTFGFARLAINAPGPAGMQPFEHGDHVGVFNGEIYNHRALRDAFGLSANEGSDAAVILPAFAQAGANLLQELDGFVSGVIYDRRAKRLFTIRDDLGKKPLFLVRCGGTFMLVSALKAVPRAAAFQVVSKGVCEVSLTSGEIKTLAPPRPSMPTAPGTDLVQTLRRAVDKRTGCHDQRRFGVFLSGGLDSSIVAALVEMGPDGDAAHYFYFDAPESEDTQFARHHLAFLGVPNSRIHPVDLPVSAEMPELISQVVYATESYNPSIISNGIGTYLLAQAARRAGCKVVLGGDGADEVFCGYFDPPNYGPDATWRSSRKRLIADLHQTELRRIDAAAMAHAVELRCPFLDRDLRNFAEGMSFEDFYGSRDAPTRKSALRRAFASLLPNEITDRPKQSFDRGAGLQELVYRTCTANGDTEKAYLRAVWRQKFGQVFGGVETDPYFHAYPAFDPFIANRGARYAAAPAGSHASGEGMPCSKQ